MLSISDARNIANSFLQEACDVLKMDIQAVRLEFVPSIQMYGKEMPIVPIQGGARISDAFLTTTLSANSSTPVRSIMYTVAWMAYQPGSSPADQAAFATTLSMLKGIQPSDACLFDFVGRDKIIAVLKDVFHLDCSIARGMCEDGSIRFALRLIKDNNHHEPRPAIKVREDYQQPAKGTEDNPFENVNEAAEYIKEQEAIEWTQDAYLQEIVGSNYYFEPGPGPFRIGWASPFVAFYKNAIPDDGFVVNQLFSRRFSVKPNLYRHKFLFRGQSRFYDKCYPNLFRDEKKSNFLDDLIWANELEALVASHPLIQFVEGGIELLHDKFVFEVNYGGLTQHYYNRSPFLDLTSDIESAKFFAVTDYSAEKDEYKPTDETGLGVLYYYSLEMPDAFQDHGSYALSTIGKQIFMRSGAQHGFLLRMEKGVNFNDLPQVRKVFFRHDRMLSQKIFDASDSGRIYFPTDALEAACRERLEILKKNRTVSVQAVAMNLAFNRNESAKSIVSKLATKGIRVDDKLRPKFPETYLSRQKMREMWEAFCKDVFFYSPDGLLYQNAMRVFVRNM